MTRTNPEDGAVTAPGAAAAAGRCTTILMNGRAGALHATAGVDEVRELAAEIGLVAEVVGTTSAEHMRATIRRLVQGGEERIAVAGGDGTIALAVQELAHTGTALGIIPQGTANNFATALRLPSDLPSALRVLLDGVVREVDLGKVGPTRTGGDRYFTESAGIGLFADALSLYGAGTNKNIVRAFYAIARLFLSVRARRVRLIVDGEVLSERAVMCEVMNTYRMAYALPVAPGARLTDGELDVIVVGDLRRGELIPYYRAFRAQMHRSLEKVQSLRAREVRIETRHRMNVHCDDRVIGTTPVTITAQPRALKVLVDRL
jgi:diacylglycerol kinase (ATP)